MQSPFDSAHSHLLSCIASSDKIESPKIAITGIHALPQKRRALFASALTKGMTLIILKAVTTRPVANRF